MNEADAILISLTRDGDRQAFGRLVERYQDRLYTTLVHLVGCHEEARDVCQEAFVQAFTKLDRFQGASAFYTWLYRIAFNTAISRRRRRRPALSVDASPSGQGPEPVDSEPPPVERLEARETVDRVRIGLEALSDEHRQVLVLHEFEKLRYEEIADVLGVPVGTVRSRLFRARAAFKERMQQLIPDLSD